MYSLLINDPYLKKYNQSYILLYCVLQGIDTQELNNHK